MADTKISPITFPLYYDRWTAATRHLTAAARGVYIDWLGWSWNRDKALPLDAGVRARIAAVTPEELARLWPELSEFWEETPDGYVNHSLERKRTEHRDYHASQREKSLKGVAARRAKATPGSTPGSTPGQPGKQPSDLGSRSSDLDLRSSDLDVAKNEDLDLVKIETHSRSSSSRGGKNGSEWVEPHPNPHGKPTNLINGPEMRKHGQHAWCAKGRANLCVPLALHSEIMDATQKPEQDVKAWYAATIAKFNGQPIGDDRFVFWRNELASWVGTVTAAPRTTQTKGNSSIAAYHRVAEAIKTGKFEEFSKNLKRLK